MTQVDTFRLLETTIEEIAGAYARKELSAKELVQLYLKRIEFLDQAGPQINSVISLNPDALAIAEKLDDAYRASGPVGPLHGIPILLKDQMDAKGMSTTLGSVLFKDFYPDNDSFVAARLKDKGAIILGKVTLGELGGGDTHGTLFGSTRNPYDLERTVGGSSGGSAAAVNANFSTVAVGQEGFASIRRPSAWNSIVGMRPTPGLVSRTGVWGCWPSRTGSLGPMARSVTDLATLLDCMVAYDSEDPQTAHGYGKAPASYAPSLDADGLKGARLGIVRQVMSATSEPGSDDFKKVTKVYERALGELADAGATLIDIEIPQLTELLAKRAGEGSEDAFVAYMSRNARPPYASEAEMKALPGYEQYLALRGNRRNTGAYAAPGPNAYFEYLKARDQLETNVLKVMADNQLDAIVHKSVEHFPTLIRDGVNPPHVNSKGVPHINTFLIYAASMTVPAGFSDEGLPAGITFFGRPYTEPALIKFAYAYEQATKHRVPPNTTPALPGE